jgi:acyl-coenzyme A thioesterase PaaI-like protein
MTEWQPTSRLCFVCGRENPVGLKVRWENDREAGEIRGTVEVPEHFNSYPGVVHGGVVAAVLDETAGRALLLQGGPDDLMMTLKLEVAYRRPTPTATPLALVGRLRRRTASRAEAEAVLRLPDGTVSASATVLLVRPPEAISSGWADERPYWKVVEPA